MTSRSSGQSQCCQHPPHNGYVQESNLSSKSIGLAFGQSFWSMALVKLKSIGFVYIIISVIVVKVRSVGLQTYCPLGKRIFAVSMDPTSMAGPRYCPGMALLSRNLAGVMVHYPSKPTKLEYLADIGGLSGHKSLWNVSGGHIYAVSQARADQRH